MDVYGLVGNPVGHSASPPMHEAAYEATDLDARYVTFEPEPADLATAIRGADALGIAGCNVTVPYKQDVLDLVDPAPIAERIGAVNTIDFATDPPRGHNTDATGVTRAFRHHDVAVRDRDAVVVGAGGAGRAAAFGLGEAGARVHVANRTAERARDLAAVLDDHVDGPVGASGLDELDAVVPEADLLVNATTVGMEEDETPIPAALLHDDCAVLDAVYAPLETRLLREAAAAGATTIDGAWMLLFQGAAAFECWTDCPAPVDAMNAALRDHLAAETDAV